MAAATGTTPSDVRRGHQSPRPKGRGKFRALFRFLRLLILECDIDRSYYKQRMPKISFVGT